MTETQKCIANRLRLERQEIEDLPCLIHSYIAISIGESLGRGIGWLTQSYGRVKVAVINPRATESFGS